MWRSVGRDMNVLGLCAVSTLCLISEPGLAILATIKADLRTWIELTAPTVLPVMIVLLVGRRWWARMVPKRTSRSGFFGLRWGSAKPSDIGPPARSRG